MKYCNKGIVRADPLPPPVMVKDHTLTIFFNSSLTDITVSHLYKTVLTRCFFFQKCCSQLDCACLHCSCIFLDIQDFFYICSKYSNWFIKSKSNKIGNYIMYADGLGGPFRPATKSGYLLWAMLSISLMVQMSQIIVLKV